MSTDQFSVLRDLDRAAVLEAARLAGRIQPDDLGRATPCDGWDLATLLAHLSGQHRGFAAAARGRGGDLAVWRSREPAADPVADFLSATGEVLAAFSAPGVPGRRFELPEISTSIDFPAAQAVRFHLVDYVVHSWDLARSLAVRPDLGQPVLAAAWEIAQAVPDSSRDQPGAAFGPRQPTAPGGPLLDQIVALLGRSPDWAPAGRGPADHGPVGVS
jgi:uncharacterized protein (TIGR03086 family)